VTARALMRLVEQSIEDRWRLSLVETEAKLFGNPIIAV
jgi:hypothetical protein